MNAYLAQSRRGRARGVTLVETMAAIVILGVMAAASLPMVEGATEAYLQSSTLRRSTESVAFALDRCVRLLRAVPLAADGQSVGIATLSSSAIRLSDGRGLELSGTTLMLRDKFGTSAPLCADVTSFVLQPLASDGVTSTLATPATTRRFNITIKTAQVELRGTAFVRVGALGL